MRRINRSMLLRWLGIAAKIPANRTGMWRRVPLYSCRTYSPWARATIVLTPSPGPLSTRNSSTHRLFYLCQCGELRPTGRSSQHLKACLSLAGSCGLAEDTPWSILRDVLLDQGKEGLVAEIDPMIIIAERPILDLWETGVLALSSQA